MPTPLLESPLSSITSPVKWSFWEEHLCNHEDRNFAGLIIGRLQRDFRIGFERSGILLQSAMSANAHQELKLGRIALIWTHR